jgi:hypothetical protein
MHLRIAALALALAACGRGGISDPSSEQPSGLAACADCSRGAYDPKDGFVVHEWGTFTSVVGTDGLLLPGLHHEEEDLPGFVADRVAAGRETPGTVQKMETPVTYFYAPAPMRASASVRFPSGYFTQWFPWVQRFSPVLYYPTSGDPETPVDPWLMTNVSMPDWCVEKYAGPMKDGLLDWGEFDVLTRDAKMPLASPVGDGHYRFARNVASNPLRITAPRDLGEQYEQFLFYRGLGNFVLPLTSRFENGKAVLSNSLSSKTLGGLVLMNVTSEGAGFVELGDLSALSELRSPVPAATQRHEDFVVSLKAKLRARLEADGLYADEAQAMVDTWEQSYFLTPGVRLLYLLPQSETEALLPLTISPKPRATLRTMVIRVELLTPEQEQAHAGWLKDLAAAPTAAAARASFLAQGRFSEPYLRRALARSTDAAEQSAGAALLAEIQAHHRWQPLTAD